MWKPMTRRFLILLSLLATGAAAAETRYTYDKNGRLTRVEFSDGRAILYTYDAAGNLVRREFIAPAAPPGPQTDRRRSPR